MGADPISATMAALSQFGPHIAAAAQVAGPAAQAAEGASLFSQIGSAASQGMGILKGANEASQLLGGMGGQRQQQQQSQFPRIGVDATMYPRPSQSRDLLRMRSQMPADLWQKLEQQGLLNSF